MMASAKRFPVGPLCSGSILPRDTVPPMAALLRMLDPAGWDQAFAPANGFPLVPSYAQEESRSGWWSSEAASDVHDMLIDALSELAPDGYWFGAHPDDPACLGFWPDSFLE